MGGQSTRTRDEGKMDGRVCKTANVVSHLGAVGGKHVGASLVFDGKGRQLGGVFGFLSVGVA